VGGEVVDAAEEPPAEEGTEEGEGGFWQRVLRLLRGLLGLGS